MGQRPASAVVDANARSGGLKIVRAQNGMRTGTYCAVCRAPQVMTPGGVVCDNPDPAAGGHGGADSIDASGMRVYVERDETPVHPVYAEQYGHKTSGSSGSATSDRVSEPSAPTTVRDSRAAEGPGSRAPLPGVPGESVTVSRGEWTVQPVKYNAFRVGEVSITTAVREGETLGAAASRAYAEARQIQIENSRTDLHDYLAYLEEVGAEVTRRSE